MDTQNLSDEQRLKDAQEFVRKNQSRLERGSKELSDEVYKRIQARLNELRHAIKENDSRQIEKLTRDCDEMLEEHLGPEQKSTWREYAESIGLAILFALVLRSFVVEAFKIPTGSMIPTLLIGDHLFVNKFIYGIRVPLTKNYLVRFAEPERGEIVVFTFPSKQAREHIASRPVSERECIDRDSLENEKDFIKRVIGVEGDSVELRENRILLNGEPLEQTFIKKETTGNFMFPHNFQERQQLNGHDYIIQYSGSDQNFGPIKVKPGHVFVMGDNRDNSSDSRCWGQVPVANIKGRASIIWWSIDPHEGMRWNRIGTIID